MNYSEAEEYLFSLCLHGIKLGLDNINNMLELLGNPHKNLFFIHVAGTNGKGSVCAILNAVLSAGGYKAGVFTSPHLISMRERFKVGGRIIPAAAFVSSVKRVKKVIRLLNGRGQYPTFFEAVTAVAVDYFFRKNVDVVVWETGMGGTYDSTNAVYSPISIITNVGLDHCQYLGGTIAEIAEDKAGIIKKESVFITASTDNKALNVFLKRCKKLNAKMISLNKDFKLNGTINKFDYYSDKVKWKNLKTNLAGGYQKNNVAAGITAAVYAFNKLNPSLSANEIEVFVREGLRKVKINGRFQIAGKKPVVVIDTAHNPHGIAALRDALVERFGGTKINLVFGMVADKDYDECCKIISPLCSRIFCVKPLTSRALEPAELALSCARYAANGVEVTCNMTLRSVLENFYNISLHEPEEVLVICGSFYLAGEALRVMGKNRVKILDKETDYR